MLVFILPGDDYKAIAPGTRKKPRSQIISRLNEGSIKRMRISLGIEMTRRRLWILRFDIGFYDSGGATRILYGVSTTASPATPRPFSTSVAAQFVFIRVFNLPELDYRIIER